MNRRSNGARGKRVNGAYWLSFLIIFFLSLAGVIVALNHERRIFPGWSDSKFLTVGIFLSVGHAAFLAGCGLLVSRIAKRRTTIKSTDVVR